MKTYYATYEGQTRSQNSSREFNFASVVYIPWKDETVVGYSFSKTEKGARAAGLAPHQKEAGMKVIAVVPVTTEAPEEANEEAPVTETVTTVNVDVVAPGKALMVLSDRDGGQLLRDGREWAAEDSYGSGETVGTRNTLKDAAELLARHLGVTGPLRVTIERD